MATSNRQQSIPNNDVDLSYQIFNMIINNEWNACEELLATQKDNSALLNYCYGFFQFIKSVFLYEEKQFEKTIKDLDSIQKYLKESLKSATVLKRSLATSPATAKAQNMEDIIQKQILLADCKLFTSLAYLMRQDVTGIITTAVFELRRAWKIYSSLQKTLFTFFKNLDPNAEQIYGTDPNRLPDMVGEDNTDDSQLKDDAELADDSALNDSSPIPLNVVKSLLASVSFGYGVIQLSFSFLQPNLLKLLKFIGFDGDRSAALKALFFTSQNKDLRSPYADMIMILYSTMVRQLCGYSETDMFLNYKDMQQLLEKNLAKTPNSCLFLILKGKVEFMNKNFDHSVEVYKLSCVNGSNIRELESLASYELGLLYLLSSKYDLALECFEKFTKNSKWSQLFNNYLLALVNGSLGNFDKVDEYFKVKVKLSQRKNPMEAYALKRIEYLKTVQEKQSIIYAFFCIELLYLWDYLPYGKRDDLIKMLEVLYQQTEKNVYPITSLIEATIRIELENCEFAEQLLKETLARIENEKNPTFEKYVQPFVYLVMSYMNIERNNLDGAIFTLNKAKQFKDYDHEERLQLQIRTLTRRIEYKKTLAK